MPAISCIGPRGLLRKEGNYLGTHCLPQMSLRRTRPIYPPVILTTHGRNTEMIEKPCSEHCCMTNERLSVLISLSLSF